MMRPNFRATVEIENNLQIIWHSTRMHTEAAAQFTALVMHFTWEESAYDLEGAAFGRLKKLLQALGGGSRSPVCRMPPRCQPGAGHRTELRALCRLL